MTTTKPVRSRADYLLEEARHRLAEGDDVSAVSAARASLEATVAERIARSGLGAEAVPFCSIGALCHCLRTHKVIGEWLQGSVLELHADLCAVAHGRGLTPVVAKALVGRAAEARKLLSTVQSRSNASPVVASLSTTLQQSRIRR